jgi:hypothetical protein
MAEIEFSITNNPHFERIERAPYELGYLLKKIPERFSSLEPQTEESCLIAVAAAQHASNANDTVMYGLEALGQILFVASNNEQNEVCPRLIGHIGSLIQHLAVEAQFLQETADNLRYALNEQEKRLAKKGGTK